MTTPLKAAAGLLGRLFAPTCSSALVATAALTLPPAQVAHASDEWQFAGWSESMWDNWGMMGATAAPPITARDLRLYAEVLALDEMQLEIMQDAYEDFERTFMRESTLYSEVRSDAQHAHNPGGDWTHMQKRFADIKADFDQKIDRMEEQFISDLRLVLRQDQIDRWQRLEREQRRAKTLAKYGSYPEEKIDLVASVHALNLSAAERQSLEALLEDYRVQIDSVLVSRNRRAEQLGKQYLEFQKFQTQMQTMDDPMQMQTMYERYSELQQGLVPSGLELRRACARVREVNNQFRTRIEEALPAHALDEFRKVVTPRSDDDPYAFMGYSRVSMMLRLLENLEVMLQAGEMQVDMWSEGDSEQIARYYRIMRSVQPLTEHQRSQIAALKDEWEQASASIRARYAKPTRNESEPDYIRLPTPEGTLMLARASADGAMMGFPGRGGEPNSDDERRQKEQSELDQRIIDRIRAMLTMEQRALFAMM